VAEDYEPLNAAQTVSETDSFTAYRYVQFARHLGSAMRILDVGCNTGRGGVVLRQVKPSAHIEGLEMLAARAALVPAGVYDAVTLGDLAMLAGAGAQFDALVMRELIEHVPYPALEDFLPSAATVLSPGWPYPSSHPEPSLPVREVARRVGPRRAPVSVHSPLALTELLNRGFRVVRVDGTGPVSRAVGLRFPLGVYGSFMLIAERHISASRGR